MPRSAAVGGERPGGPGRWPLLIVIPLALSAWVYWPLTRVSFFADDFMHMASIESDRTLEFLLAPFGGHNYLVRNVIFLASWEVFGLRASLYFGTVLGVHLLNVCLLFRVLKTLTASVALACFGAALWGTSPLAVGTLGWYSVFGQVLVASVLLVVLDRLTRLAAAGDPLPTRTAWLWYALLLAGTTCFGTGIGVALAFPLVVLLFLPAAWRRPLLRVAWLLLPVVTLALWFGFRRLYPLIAPLPWEERFQEYTALHGFGRVPAMLGGLLAFSISGSTLAFFMPTTYPSTASSVAVAAYVAGLALVLWRGDGATRRAAIAMVLLAGAIYLLIAAGRSNTYAMFKIPPAKAATVARYHYVGSVPVVILLCLILRQLGQLPGLRVVPAPLALAAGLAYLTYGVASIGVRIQDYRWTRDYVTRTADEITAAVRAGPPGATVYVENGTTPASILGPAIPNRLFPGRAGVFVLLHPTDDLDGRTVRFIEPNAEVIAYYRERPNTRFAHLLVAPADVAARR